METFDKSSVTVGTVKVEGDIQGILRLHETNLRKNISLEEQDLEGFVSAEYDMRQLQLMNTMCPSIVAKVGERVIGYALVVTKEFYGHNPLLDDLMNSIDELVSMKYVIVGQLCVEKSYRGKGIVPLMYNFFRDELSGEFDCCVTDVNERNPRSLKAHIKSGFEIIETKQYDGCQWHIVLWDWRA